LEFTSLIAPKLKVDVGAKGMRRLKLLGACALTLFLCFGCAHEQRSILVIREDASAAVKLLTPGMTLEAVDKALAERGFVYDGAIGSEKIGLFYLPAEASHLSHETKRPSEFLHWLGANGILERAQVLDNGLGVIATFIRLRNQRGTRIPQQPAGGDGGPAPQP
jgi:hypothetical protein